MKHATIDTVSVDFECGAGNVFRSTGSTIADPGFMEVYQEGKDDNDQEPEQSNLPVLKENDVVNLKDIRAEQHFTEPPPLK